MALRPTQSAGKLKGENGCSRGEDDIGSLAFATTRLTRDGEMNVVLRPCDVLRSESRTYLSL